MKGNKRNGFIKVLAAFVCCGVLCFIFTGAAELNASDLHTGQPLLSGLVNGGASLSALLTVPRFDFDKVISDYNRQESDNTSSQGSITEKEEQTPQTDSNQTSSDIHTSDGQSREESGTNTNSDAPAEDVLVDVSEPLTPETKIISLNLRGDKNDLADFTAKDGEIRRVTYTPLEADNIINLENGQLRNCTELENGDILKIASKPADIDIELNNGKIIPSIGFGTWKLKNNEETVEIIKDAIKCGYRHIDTAFAYGNEETIGKGIKESNIDRKDLFITGKLWNDDRGYENIINACKRTIKNLNCEYLDLYLIHWPASKAVHDDWIEINKETWQALEYLYEQGLVKAIGVCNFKINQLEELIKTAKIKPMVNQIEFHIGVYNKDILDYCNRNNIVVEAWSPLGSGKLFKVEELKLMASKYNVSVAQLCIRWCLQNNTLPLPKSKNIERIKNNLDVFNFEITNEDMEYLNNFRKVGSSGLDSETITLFN